MKFKCIEYKKDGNTPKIVTRDLMPINGISNLYYLLEDKYNARVYKSAKGYAISVARVLPEHITHPKLRRQMAEVDGVSVCELVKAGRLFPGRVVLEFLRLTATTEELNTATEIRRQCDIAQEEAERKKEAEKERKRAQEEENERKRIEALQMEATEVYMRGEGCISSEALELLAYHCGISIHPRTLGVLRNSVKYVYLEGDKYKLQAHRGIKKNTNFGGVFRLMNEIHNCIEDVRRFLNGEDICA